MNHYRTHQDAAILLLFLFVRTDLRRNLFILGNKLSVSIFIGLDLLCVSLYCSNISSIVPDNVYIPYVYIGITLGERTYNLRAQICNFEPLRT